MEAICVAVRVRPLKEDAVVAGTGRGNFWRVGNNSISLHAPNGIQIPGYSFIFDHVFGDDSRNASIYEAHTKDVIQAAVHGFNGTVFAYGQTSSGKTYTMQGSEADPGIIRLAVNNVFQRIQTISDREFLIRVSYLEIYNEEINDLLFPENKKLQVHENLERGIFVAGLREEIVNNPEQVFELIELGEAHRHVGETNMNVRSSRSHTIFRMVIESKGKNVDSGGNLINKDAVRVSVLNLVDLAGSERVSKTGAGGVRLKEGTHINKSLMSLGTVINKLSDGSGKNRGHIPYRDSKLTRILQPALGGNAKTAIICTVAPEEVHTDETRGTLQFASRAKKVTNCAQVNEIVTDAALLKRQKREIEDLKRKLEGSHSEVLEQEILKLRNEMLKFELERERLAMELEEERKAQLERDRRIMEQQMKIDDLSTLVINSDQERNSFRSSGADNAYPWKLSQDFSEMERYKEGSVERRVTLRREKFSLRSESDVSCSDESKRFSSRMSDRNSLPSDFENVADEDTWMTMNGGQIMTDLDFLQPSPFKKSLSVRSGVSSGSAEQYQVEIENLKQELQKALQEKNEAEQSLEHQISLNGELKNALTVMESEAMVMGDISQKIAKVMIESKEDQKEMSSYFKSLPLEDKQGCRIVDFKSNFLQLVKLLDEYKQENEHLHQQCQILDKQLKHAVASLMLNNNEQNSKNKGHGNMLYKDTSSDFPSSVVVSFKPGTSTIGGSNMRLIPCQETFKDICNKVCSLDAMDGQAAAIDIAALCSTLSDSKTIPEFIKALQTSQSSEVFDNMDTSEGCVKLEKLEADVVGNIFLAKWLIREMTNLAKYRDFLHSSSKVTMCGNYQKNMKTLRACLKQMKEAAESLPYLQDPEDCHFEDENISLEHQDLQTKCAYLWERLQMSSEHILSLDNKIALLSIEKETIAKALDCEFQRQEQRELEHGFLMEQHRQISAKLAARMDTYSRIRCQQRISDEEFQTKLAY